jgi:DNA-binding response OmpR family regulator
MPKPRILIVDDEPQMLAVLTRALDMLFYDTQIASSAQTAMDLVQAAPPDAILVDLKMPYINGLGFLHRLRAEYPSLPVAIITASSPLDHETLVEIRDLGAELRFKPIAVAETHTLVRELLARVNSTNGDDVHDVVGAEAVQPR